MATAHTYRPAHGGYPGEGPPSPVFDTIDGRRP